jgi:predicted nucleic acid-binding protein
MIFAHSLLRRYVAEDVILLLIVSTHVAFDALCSASSHNCWFFQQPVREWARFMEGKSDHLLEDAMIAATARVHALKVATRNENDFDHFPVDLVNPFKHHA